MEPSGGRRSGGHGALMDSVYRRQRYIYDATRKYFLLGRDRLLSELKPERDQTVLEVGCGTGRNLILAAKRHPYAHFYGFDISEQMLETARAKINRAQLAHRITLAQADATDFNVYDLFGVETVDRVFYSYTLSMIPDWPAAVEQGLAALAPEGRLHAVDFGQLERLPAPAKAALGRWLAAFHVEPRKDLREVLSRAARAAGREHIVFKPLYRGYAWFATIR